MLARTFLLVNEAALGMLQAAAILQVFLLSYTRLTVRAKFKVNLEFELPVEV